jgi:hypothetical protein
MYRFRNEKNNIQLIEITKDLFLIAVLVSFALSFFFLFLSYGIYAHTKYKIKIKKKREENLLSIIIYNIFLCFFFASNSILMCLRKRKHLKCILIRKSKKLS